MTDKLPPNLLALFASRPPLRWLEQPDFAPEKRKTAPIDGVAAFLPQLAKYKETDEYSPTESWLEMKDRKKLEKQEAVKKLLTEGPKTYKPNEDPNIRGDAFKTMIVARLSYEADERDLEREFGRFGPIERIRIIKDIKAHEKPNKKTKPHRGYAFVVFEREKDMRVAIEQSDGIRIKDRVIKVDVERGRTTKAWLPRRLGGGLGGRGYTKAMPARPMGVGPGGYGGPGGFRGGGRGFGAFEGRGGGRGGFPGRSRGGFGGGDRFARGGDRNGYGAPSGAPSGPGGFDRRNGGDRGFSGGGFDSRGGGRSFDDRQGGFGGRDGGRGYGGRDAGRQTGSNMEPIGSRDARRDDRRDDRRDGHRDGPRDDSRRDREYNRDYDRPPRDDDRPRDDDNRKRGYDGGGYDSDPRKLRRY